MRQADVVPPTMGLLTQTVVPSPVINWIIPARIRHKEKNDILVIGETWVQIKELRHDGHLRDVAKLANIDARIRHAKVFGAARESAVPGLDGYVKKENPDSDIDMADDDPNLASTGQSETTKLPISLPPQVLVLSLDTDDLLFVYANERPDGMVEFSTSLRPLWTERSSLEQLGRHIAVDPKSRAFAVAACQKCVMLYSLYDISKYPKEITHNHLFGLGGLDPFRGERYLEVDGVILYMDFLYPAPGDETHVILLLLVSVSGERQPRLLVYEWDSSLPISTAKLRHTNLLSTNESFESTVPLLLVPLKIASSFMFIWESTLAVYTGILEGQIERVFYGDVQSITSTPEIPSPGVQLCTSWARPLRTLKFTSRLDVIYLAREDGQVILVEIDTDVSGWVNVFAPTGLLRGFVNTAFAALDHAINQSDVLVGGGDMSTGGLYVARARGHPELVETVSNWTPLVDFIPVNISGPPLVSDPEAGMKRDHPIRVRDRIFALTGRASEGSISEMRRGLEARIGTILPYHGGVNRAWSLPDCAGTGTYLLIFFPTHTELLYVSADLESIEQKDEDDCSGLDLASTTLAAGGYGEVTVQVTQTSIHVARLGAPRPDDGSGACFQNRDPGESIFAASLHPSSSSIITVTKRADELFMNRLQLDDEDTCTIIETGQAIALSSEPSCLHAFEFQNDLYIVVGTTDCTLQFYRANSGYGLVRLLEHSLTDEPPSSPFSICESAVYLECPPIGDDPSKLGRLVCGLRDGYIKSYAISLCDSGEISLHSPQVFLVGETSVEVIVDDAASDGAFVVCGPDCCRLQLEEGMIVGRSLQKIYLTDHNQPSFQQDNISTLVRIQSQPHLIESGFLGAVACFSKDHMMLVDLEHNCKPVPRWLEVGGTPRKILHSAHLGIFVVAYSKRRLERVAQRRRVGVHGEFQGPDFTSTFIPALRFIDPDNGPLDSNFNTLREKDGGEAWSGPEQPREKIFDLLEWTCTDGTSKYLYIIVATGRVGKRVTARHRGRLLLLTASKRADGQIEVKQKYSLSHESPIYCVTAFGPSSLIICSGTDIIVRKLNIAERRFETITECSLRSPCTMVTVHEPFIYASTVADSLITLKFENDKLFPYSSDSTARAGHTHLRVPDSNIMLATDKESTVVGLWQPPDRRNRTGASVVFEAELPTIVTRLHFVSVRPRWVPRNKELPGVVRFGNASERELDILGSSIDGSFRQLAFLTEKAWRLLRFVQNVAARFKKICPVQDRHNAGSHIEPTNGPARFKHVDGDILARVVSLGAAELESMLKAEVASKSGRKKALDFASSIARWERFEVLVEDLFGKGTHDPVGTVTRYMGLLLEPKMQSIY